MYLPRGLYEALPYLYVAAGLGACVASYLGSAAPWSNLVFAAGFAAIVGGSVLILRRKSYRADAAHYDHRPLDE